MPDRPESLLVVDDLCKSFRGRSGWRRGAGTGSVYAVRKVSFALRHGGSLGLVGESGSGKTTIARIIAGLEYPTSGAVLLEGAPVAPGGRAAERRSRARAVQMVFQDPYMSLDPRLSVMDALDEVQRVHFNRSKGVRRKRTLELVDAVELTARDAGSRPRHLSGGQRQRAAIARGLAAEPKLLVLDEAVSALDVSVQAQVINLLNDLRRQLELTYLSISHDLGVIRQVADEVVVLYRGVVVERGSAVDVLDASAHPYTRRLRAAAPVPGKALPAVEEQRASFDDGCVFRHRCELVGPDCVAEPDAREVTPGHLARCFRVGQTVSTSSVG